MIPMDKTYDPASVESKWYERWTQSNAFHSESGKGGDPYCVVIPPPNVTGILHMGHALNNTIQDILIRWRRMQGRNVVWMPGTDHAGIATQNVVERSLRKEGKSRADLGREEFVKRVWEWREEYGSTIIRQLKKLGASCDWDRERFTMDEGLSKAVTEVFVRLYDKGLIYRGNYIINWCSRCHTALSDEESEHEDVQGKLYYIRYRVGRTTDGKPGTKKQEAGTADYIVVATTRPETLLGDVAVAINPKDERYAGLGGCRVVLPVLGRKLKVIQDEFVDPEFGTGIVKVTPAHDPNDFEMGLRHELEPINVMNGDGTMNSMAGPYEGLDRLECRKRILADLEKEGLIEKIEDHSHSVGHCYRCGTVVEPRLSLQWFVRMKELAGPAIEAVEDGRIKFVPARWTKVYLEWMRNIRDWCISRQIWWGHRIPVFYCDDCGNEWAARDVPKRCPKCESEAVRQDEDVLDTWFSSWLWPFSTFGWPQENDDLSFYYPTNDLVTASEIIFFWVARMIMAGFEFMGKEPFSTVYIHGTVRDDLGRKMSKSLGNSLDPLIIIDKYSADALRFSLMMITATGQDIFVSDKKFEIGRNFGTKIWNAARLMKSKDEGEPDTGSDFNAELLRADDRHIIWRLNRAVRECTENLEKYRYNDAAQVIYEFIWHQYCDWYIEYAKEMLYDEDSPRRREVLKVMHYVFSSALKLLHPMMPFLTEELWHVMGYAASERDFIMLEKWPELQSDETLHKWGIELAGVEYVEKKHDLVRAGRTLRSDYDIPPKRKVKYMVKATSDEDTEALLKDLDSLKLLLAAEEIEIGADIEPGRAMPSAISALGSIYLPLEGLIDVEAEKVKLAGQIEKLDRELAKIGGKLESTEFVQKAPQEIIDREKERKEELSEKRSRLNRLMQALGSS